MTANGTLLRPLRPKEIRSQQVDRVEDFLRQPHRLGNQQLALLGSTIARARTQGVESLSQFLQSMAEIGISHNFDCGDAS